MIEKEVLRPIVEQIEALVKDVPGWSPIDQLVSLFHLAYLTNVEGDIVEIGSWCGRSASVLGLAATLTGGVNVHCIDLFPERTDWRKNWDGSYSFSVAVNGQMIGAYEEQTVWDEPYKRDIEPLYDKYGDIYKLFVSTIRRNNVEQVVIPFKGNLAMFCEHVSTDFKCKLAFLDGDHSYKAVCDEIELLERFLVPGGWICFDDAFSTYDGVNKAIEEKIIKNRNYELCHQVTRKFFIARRRVGGDVEGNSNE